MLRIRLQRSGRKGRANYRIVVAEHSAPIQGRSAALLGTYDPLIDKHGLKIDREALVAWIKKGAKPTNTVARLLKGQGVEGMESFILQMKDKKVKNPKEKPEAPATPVVEAKEAPVEEKPVEATPTEEPAPASEEKTAETPPVEEKPVEATPTEAEAPPAEEKAA